ncbi:HAMP domain-containing protein [Marinomonas agarivorans]|nr:HAMP domain-containing protein [Marinomonas agarivorans]
MKKLFYALKLKYKLFLIFAINNIIIIGCMWQVSLWSFDQGFFNYTSQQDKSYLQQMATRSGYLYYYYDNWDFLIYESELATKWYKKQLGKTSLAPPPSTPNLDLIYPSQSYRKRFLLYNKHQEPLIGDLSFSKATTKPVYLDGRLIGYIGLRPLNSILQDHNLKFMKQQGEAFLLIAAFVLTIAAFITWWLAKLLSQPICEMSQATRRLASGNYDTRIRSKYADELGQLAFDLNHLASTLENSSQARKRWVADTAHELRTPLAILRGEIEAMQDGIIKVTPESLNSLFQETVHLGRLIDDLNQLSMHDTGSMSYKMEDTDLVTILEQTINSMQRSFDDAGLKLSFETNKKKSIPIIGDADRLAQVFSNLMSNTLKYTNAPGELAIATQCSNGFTTVILEDSAPGLNEEDIEKIFDRFFRAECSRNRSSGGRGLGLSICRSIIEGHQGQISAYNSPKGGVGIKIVLPTV